MSNEAMTVSVTDCKLELDRDIFLRSLIRELSGTLQEVIGLEEASGFISLVGQKMGKWINKSYCEALQVSKLSRKQVAEVLVDLKRRIEGDFYLVSVDEEKIVLGNRRCPFGEKVIDRSSLCMMTSNVFGAITAENLGYAKVVLNETIASGSEGCHVVVYIKETEVSEKNSGLEFFKTEIRNG